MAVDQYQLSQQLLGQVLRFLLLKTHHFYNCAMMEDGATSRRLALQRVYTQAPSEAQNYRAVILLQHFATWRSALWEHGVFIHEGFYKCLKSFWLPKVKGRCLSSEVGINLLSISFLLLSTCKHAGAIFPLPFFVVWLWGCQFQSVGWAPTSVQTERVMDWSPWKRVLMFPRGCTLQVSVILWLFPSCHRKVSFCDCQWNNWLP